MIVQLFFLLCLMTNAGLSLRHPMMAKFMTTKSTPSIELVSMIDEDTLSKVSQEESKDSICQQQGNTTIINKVNDLMLTAVNDRDRINLYEQVVNEPGTLSMMNRVGYNTVINSFCKMKNYTEALKVITLMNKMNISLAPDTAHIILQNSFKNDTSGKTAEYYYNKYFTSLKEQDNRNNFLLVPTARTLNIMMEGFRSTNSISKVLKYYDMFSKLNIQPDIYTISSRVRVSTSSQECLNFLTDAMNNDMAQSPLVRCVVETLGELGSPAIAYSVASKYFSEGNRFNESSITGDSLLAALLNSKSNTAMMMKSSSSTSTKMKKTMTKSGKEKERNQLNSGNTNVYSINDNDDIPTKSNDSSDKDTNIGGQSSTLFAMKLILKNKIKFGPKGFCIVLSHFQKLRQMENSNDLSLDLGDGQVIELKSVDNFRDILWENVKSQNLINGDNLNGRVCDALLRSYDTNIEAARNVWKNELLPIADEIRKNRGNDAYREIAEKAFEGLMYICGVTYRPDIALEIALAVRKRNWSLPVRTRLSQAYSRGYTRTGSKASTPRASKFDILNKGLERSVEAELGVLFAHYQTNDIKKGNQKNDKITRIRVKFK